MAKLIHTYVHKFVLCVFDNVGTTEQLEGVLSAVADVSTCDLRGKEGTLNTYNMHSSCCVDLWQELYTL